MSEDDQVKEAPQSRVTRRALTGARAEECLMILEPAAHSASIPTFYSEHQPWSDYRKARGKLQHELCGRVSLPTAVSFNKQDRLPVSRR